jgi:Pvc16 N-terminal domain
MSNYQAVAAVTAALQQLLQGPVGLDVPGAKVSTDRPDQRHGSAEPGVNLYLYQVVPNAALRNGDLPTRTSDGLAVRRPVEALDLHYLLTFYGDDGELEPQLVLGSTVRTLHARPLITGDLIQAVVDAANATPTPVHPALKDIDLDRQVEVVKLTPLPLGLEELSKLWSVFFQTPYALSVAYLASLVLIEQEVAAQPGPPVQRSDLQVVALLDPTIDRVAVEGQPDRPATAADTIALEGRQLRGPTGTNLRVAGFDLPVDSTSENLVTFDLATVPAGALRPGPTGVRVVHPVVFGGTPRPGRTSNLATFLLHPRVTAVTASGTGAGVTVTATTDLTVGAGQRAAVLLLDPADESLRRLAPAADRDADGTTLTAPAAGLPAGDYLAQVQVEGATSPLDRDAAGNPTGPMVTLP